MNEKIKTLISDSIAVKQAVWANAELIATIEAVVKVCIETLENKNKLLLAGNGGSAADAQHIAAELVGRFEKDRKGLPALELNTNASSLTAIANDYDYEAVFSRQLEALAQPGDMFFGFSTSGNSANIIAAIEKARSMAVYTVGMTGQGGGKMREMCDACICVPSSNTARVQEVHIMIGHIICGLIEERMFE